MEITNKIIKSDLIEWRNLEWLQGNLKAIPENSLKKLKQSLINNSFVQPFNVWENGKLWILDGHHRKLAMEQLEAEGYNIPDKLPANFVECKNKKEASKMVLLYSSIYAKADEKSLDAFLAENEIDFSEVSGEIDLPELNLDTFGVNEIDEEKLDAVPEIPKDPISKLGDIFLIDGKHRVMCGDSTIKADGEALMAGKRADMVFTDPPYGMNLEVHQWNKESKNGKYFGHNKNYKKVIGDSDSDFNPKFITNIFDFFGYCKEIFLWGADYYSEFLVEKNKGCWMVWDKRDKLENVEWKTSEFELCWSKKKHQRKIARIRWLGLHGIESEDTERRIHPTQKPTKLIIWFFEKFSFQQGETIIDLFLGSGSTLIASQQTNRICYGMELDPIYIDVILRRYKNLYPEAKFECLNREFDFETLFSKN